MEVSMRTLRIGLLSHVLVLFCGGASADTQTFSFRSPAFTGQGYSSHVATVETMEKQRRDKIKSDREAEEAARLRAEDNTNLSKFMKNVEARIYAQLSKQLTDALFSEGASDRGTVTLDGNTISYVKTSTDITLTIIKSDGQTITMTVPIGQFSF
jgi:hypothetical protein